MTEITFDGPERSETRGQLAWARTFARAEERGQEVSLTGGAPRFTGTPYRWTKAAAHDETLGLCKIPRGSRHE